MKTRKYFLKTPDVISVKGQRISSNDLIVSAIVTYSETELKGGSLSRLGIIVNGNDISCPAEIIPKKEFGRFSKKNVEGYEIVRRDLPKVLRTIDCGERYPYGDTTKTSYTLYISREVYQRESVHATEYSISTEVLDIKDLSNEKAYTFKVSVNKVLNKLIPEFEKELLFCLNLLQENLGRVDLFSSSATLEDYLKTQNIAWEIFPDGSRDKNLEKIFEGVKHLPKNVREYIEDKYDFLMSLHPESIITGFCGMRKYFGAMYSQNLVVFENLEYGNAIYVMYENWDELSKLSRTELLARSDRDFHRVKHTTYWKEKVSKLLRLKLGSANLKAEAA